MYTPMESGEFDNLGNDPIAGTMAISIEIIPFCLFFAFFKVREP